MSVTHLLIHRADIQRKTRTQVAPGKWEETCTTLFAGIRCRVFCASANERMAAQRLETQVSDTGYLEPSQEILRDDQLANVVREDGTVDPTLYRVKGVNQPSKRHHIKLSLESFSMAKPVWQEWRPQVVAAMAEERMRGRLEKAGVLLVAEMQQSVNRMNPDGHSPSLPGEPPKRVSGDLYRSIKYIISERGTNQYGARFRMLAGSWIVYARRLELGFVGTDKAGRVIDQAPRPFIVPTWERLKPQLKKILGVVK